MTAILCHGDGRMRVTYLVSLQDKYVPEERSPEHGDR
jgi:hypothetical protein